MADITDLKSIVVAKRMDDDRKDGDDAERSALNGTGPGAQIISQRAKQSSAPAKDSDGKVLAAGEHTKPQKPEHEATNGDVASQAGSDRASLKSNMKSSKAGRRHWNRRKEKAPKNEEYELDGLGDEEEKAPEKPKRFFKRRVFWIVWVPTLWTLVFLIIGVLLYVYSPFQAASNVQLWRFSFFLACMPVINVVATYILLAVVWFFESQFFTTSNVLYFMIALKSPAKYVVMSLLLLPVYIPLFLPQASLSKGANTAYHRVLSFIACIIVFTGINFLKVLLAKLMASYFHSSTHLAKMQEALNMEYYLKVLSTPHEDNKFVDLLDPEHAAEGDQSKRKRRSSLRKMAPTRLVSKYMSAPVAMIRRRASSLPTHDVLDSIADERNAERDEPEERHGLPAVKTQGAPAAATFEPPDPVLPTPRAAPTAPMSPSPLAYLSKASVPISGPAAISTVKASPAAKQTVVQFQQSLSIDRDKGKDLAAELDMRPPQLMRRNSDGGAGVAGILQGMELTEGQHNLVPGERLEAAVLHPVEAKAAEQARRLSRSQTNVEDPEAKSSRRGRRPGSSSTWTKQWRSERATEVVEEEEPEAFEELPSRGEDMTNEKGVALVATIHQVEKHLRKKQMHLPFTDQVQHSDGPTEPEARKLAFFIFWNVKPFFDRNYITQSDLEAFLSPSKAADAFGMLDRDGDGRLTLAELRSSIEEIFRERENLAVQLRDTKSVVGKLELVIGIALHLCAIFAYLLIFGIDIQKIWVLFTSIFLGFAFIFGNSIKNLFESVLYLFVQHPFDVGDIVVLDSGDRVQVEEISLLSIVMRKGDGVRQWVPLTQLVPKTLQNVTRSDNKSESFKFTVDVGIAAAVLGEVDRVVGDFVEARETDFSPSHSVQLAASADPLKLVLSVNIQFSHNGVDAGKMGDARSNLLQVISDTLKELGVMYSQAPQRTLPL